MKQIDSETKVKRNKQYNDWARKRPAYICMAIPVVLGLAMGVDDLVTTKAWMKAVVYVLSISAIGTALFFLFRFAIRDISKIYPGLILFSNRLKPSTKMLYSTDDTFSEDNKKEIRRKIKSKKNIDLQSFRDKTYKNKKYVKRVDEAIAWLLEVTRFDDILFEYNCVYGFYRNLTAALIVDAILLFVLAAINKWVRELPLGESFLWIGVAVAVITIITTLLAYSNGKIFAKKMYNVFLSLDDDKNNY